MYVHSYKIKYNSCTKPTTNKLLKGSIEYTFCILQQIFPMAVWLFRAGGLTIASRELEGSGYLDNCLRCHEKRKISNCFIS